VPAARLTRSGVWRSGPCCSLQARNEVGVVSGGAGGAAAAGGVAYQARVAAWAAARILAEERASGFWGLPRHSVDSSRMYWSSVQRGKCCAYEQRRH
jgi:hypothetical protein